MFSNQLFSQKVSIKIVMYKFEITVSTTDICAVIGNICEMNLMTF